MRRLLCFYRSLDGRPRVVEMPTLLKTDASWVKREFRNTSRGMKGDGLRMSLTHGTAVARTVEWPSKYEQKIPKNHNPDRGMVLRGFDA
jgi:hypothetical protein